MNVPASREDLGREETIFNAAVQLRDAAKRAIYLELACDGDATLRARIDKLLASDAEGAFFARPLAQPSILTSAVTAAASSESQTDVSFPEGERVGRYRLIQKIGEGGCGVVYMAEQSEPIRRRVALKIIKLGMDTKSVIARFDAERQAMALMDHPNIAKVLDAGATETGRPYFVMELVGGIKITEYCDENLVTTRLRLDLFIQVCRAIQHAHQKGVIHRDIKPSNVLVATQDGVAVPKVIDFGIAKATQGRLTDMTVFTAFEQFLGTPAYMSPEQTQLGSLDVDTRSDIYSLGVLLYELLTGKTPFDSKELLAAGLDAMRRTIQEKEPPTPSTRLKRDLAAQQVHISDQSKIKIQKSKIAPDLDWIVMKCLEKERARRYETANGLATDVQRHLSNEPVAARPASRFYEFQKTVRRHKVGFAATAIVVMALAIGVLVSTLQAVRATRAESKSGQFALFMKDMLQGVGPEVARGRDTKLLREILDKTAERVGKELKNQPELEADLRATLGHVYGDLGDYTNAAAMHQRALDIRKQLHGDEHPDVANSLSDLAAVLRGEGRLEEAEITCRNALAMRRRLLSSGHRDIAHSLNILAVVLFTQGDYAALRGEALTAQAKYAEAETLLPEALAIHRKALGNVSLEVVQSLVQLSLVLKCRGKFPEAELRAHEGLEICGRLYGDGHPLIGHLSDALGMALEGQAKLAEAEAAYREGLAVRQKCLSDQHPDLRYSFIHLGHLFLAQGRLQEAEAMFVQIMAREGDQLVYGGKAVRSGAEATLARILLGQGKLKEAEPLLRQVAERGNPGALNDLAWFVATTADPVVRTSAGAVMYAEKAVAGTSRTNVACLDTLAAAYASSGQFTNAVRTQKEAISLLRSEEAKRDYASRLRLYEANEPYRNDGELATKANYLLTQGKLPEAETTLRECLRLREKQSPEDWRTFNTKSMLGGVLLGEKKYAEAEPLLLAGYQGMKERENAIPAASKVRLKEALERLLELAKATGRLDQAAGWKQKLEELEQARNNKSSSTP
jgi:hypothetical protein